MRSAKYSEPWNFERFDVRTTSNSSKKFEENLDLKLEQKLESRKNNHVVVTPCRDVPLQHRGREQEYQPV
jgi:hypothetical protein